MQDPDTASGFYQDELQVSITFYSRGKKKKKVQQFLLKPWYGGLHFWQLLVILNFVGDVGYFPKVNKVI